MSATYAEGYIKVLPLIVTSSILCAPPSLEATVSIYRKRRRVSLDFVKLRFMNYYSQGVHKLKYTLKDDVNAGLSSQFRIVITL